MKIVQTLILPPTTSPIGSSLGFISPEFNWMSWSLSCLQLNVFYKEVELFTNEAGKQVLIDLLKLPYTKVHLLEITEIHPQWFSYYKLKTYSKQEEPFIHVDGDVFIWERLNSIENNEQLIAQNIEYIDEYYQQIYKDLKKEGFRLPAIIEREIGMAQPLISFNAGVIGGTNIDFFKYYCSQAIDFFKLNADKIAGGHSIGFNFVAEQHLFYCLAKQENYPVHCSIQKSVTDVTYFGYADFSEVPYGTKFIHLLGMYKKNVSTCIALAKRLRQDYPEYYYRVIAACKNAQIKMFLKYYNDEKVHAGELEVNRYNFNWEKRYETEKKQHLLAQKAFSSISNLKAFKFFSADIKKIKKVNKKGQAADYYLVPSSYIKAFTETEYDELDELIAMLLKEPKDFQSLINEIEPYFDDEEVERDRDDLVQLVKMKLHAGCENNIYLIR